MANIETLSRLVSEVYALCAEVEAGPQKVLLDFAGWCLEEAMCQQAGGVFPQEFLERELHQWLENRKEAEATFYDTNQEPPLPFGCKEVVYPYTTITDTGVTVLVGVKYLKKGKCLVIWPTGNRQPCTEEVIDREFKPYFGPFETLYTLEGRVAWLVAGDQLGLGLTPKKE